MVSITMSSVSIIYNFKNYESTTQANIESTPIKIESKPIKIESTPINIESTLINIESSPMNPTKIEST